MFRSINDGMSVPADLVDRGVESPSACIGAGDDVLRGAHDNFQQYPAGTYDVLGILVNSYGVGSWGGPAVIVSTGMDYDQCRHDFQSQSNGTYSTLSGGTGWLGDSDHRAYDYDQCCHDFQSESNGTYSTLSGGTGWLGDASIFAPI